MNALKSKREQSKAYREAQSFMLELLELMSLSYAPELHDRYGFGRERLEKLSAEAIKNVHECIARYDGDCTLTALRLKCESFGFRSKVGLGERGEVIWQ